ncbi:MAG: ribonuclease HII [Chloroflexota bacterium]
MPKKTDLPGLDFELDLWQMGVVRVAGMDEAGRGALAGPVFVGAVVLPPDHPSLSRTLAGVRDSKQMTPPERERWAAVVESVALAWAVGQASAAEIDALGIVPATRQAAERAIRALGLAPAFLLTDYRLELPSVQIPQKSILKGDCHCLSIAAASVLAKVHRDAFMRALDGQYPGYGLARHKGYGTQAHRAAIHQLGHSPVHRKTFRLK